eukprot:2818120-Pyramimonas_sp.AAC.1
MSKSFERPCARAVAVIPCNKWDAMRARHHARMPKLFRYLRSRKDFKIERPENISNTWFCNMNCQNRSCAPGPASS